MYYNSNKTYSYKNIFQAIIFGGLFIWLSLIYLIGHYEPILNIIICFSVFYSVGLLIINFNKQINRKLLMKLFTYAFLLRSIISLMVIYFSYNYLNHPFAMSRTGAAEDHADGRQDSLQLDWSLQGARRGTRGLVSRW